MKATRKFLPVVAGMIGVVALAATAQAQTVVNIGGSSAARNFMGQTPLNLCDAAPLPNQYISANNNYHVWSCNIGGSPTIMRYTATASADGYNKLLVPTGDPASIMTFLDHTQTTGCVGPTVQTRPSDSKQWNQTISCANTNTLTAPLHLGASDVNGSSFGQSDGLGGSQPQIDTSTLNPVATAVLPFSIFVGKNVVKATGGVPAGPISGLTRLELEGIFSGTIRDWRSIGLGTNVTNPLALDATSPIQLCLRTAGSGTKAAIAQTIMLNNPETVAVPVGGNPSYNASTSGVLSCLSGNGKSIGYMDADQVTAFLPGGADVGLAYVIKVDGTLVNDTTLANPKENLECGRYAYWTYENLTRRTTSEGAAIDAVMTAFIADASSATTIALLPVGAYWDAQSNMVAYKNADRGPLHYPAGNKTQCR